MTRGLTGEVMSDAEPGIQEDIDGANEQEGQTREEREEGDFGAIFDELEAEEAEPDEREVEQDGEGKVDGGEPDDGLAALFQERSRVEDLEELHEPIQP